MRWCRSPDSGCFPVLRVASCVCVRLRTGAIKLGCEGMPARGRWPRGKRKATFGKPAQKSDPEVGDLVGKIVHIPATEYGISVPGMFYRARVVKKDPKRKSSVILSFFEDDGSHNWMPAMEVRRWLSETGSVETTTNCHSDDYAAQTLLHIKSLSLRNSPGDQPVGGKWSEGVQAGCLAGKMEPQVMACNGHGDADVGQKAENARWKVKAGKMGTAVHALPRGRPRCVLAESQPGSIGTDWVQPVDVGEVKVQELCADGKADVEMDF
ncbi:unnamed protein product [Ostreobium quekettii]|uniref:Uncharacterized protein n=1 Tax=Ostreobium quekettii TaxID=121088 RepID=A0A8S1JGH2_9CHLO|nr:unnamed protein product [Ostreobium quekettii]|eukprot:evm.model.scf_368.9 EVM.evm.TU.scf_368.9   scf_368:79575-81061(-)